jgi:3,4-dihydroxy 2-butanone 4-phosphate synthase/GTP cyclohydrolase II
MKHALPDDLLDKTNSERVQVPNARQWSALMRISTAAKFPTKHGTFTIRVATDDFHYEHVVLCKGDVANAENVAVRIHSECLTSEVFNSLRCDCNEQLESALTYIESEGKGVLIYLKQEGRGIGLFNKIEAYSLQDTGLDTVEANEQLGLPVDSRSYELAVEILNFLQVKSVRLMTNNPTKINALQAHGVQVNEVIPIVVEPNPINYFYLETKRVKMNHLV